jgi:hypothetical protein
MSGTREIVLKAQISGTRNGKDWPAPGARLILSDDEANGLVNSGMAYEGDDERVRHIGNGNGGEVFGDELLAGAPTARDWTEGQQDTNLSRARALALDEADTREVTRAAAERVQLDDAHTIPQADPNRPLVGDDKPNPTDTPSVVALPKEITADGDSVPDDDAKLVDDTRDREAKANRTTGRSTGDDVESAEISPKGETAALDTSPRAANKRTTK